VRRAAKECRDLPTLQARLAEQITNSAAREAFLGPGSRGGTGTGGSTGTGGTAGRAGTPTTAGKAGTFVGATQPVNEALMDQALRLLSEHLGPIARVVVKRSAERTRQREAFYSLLAEAAPEPVRAKLLDDLRKLP